jgi:hypothetical protein
MFVLHRAGVGVASLAELCSPHGVALSTEIQPPKPFTLYLQRPMVSVPGYFNLPLSM